MKKFILPVLLPILTAFLVYCYDRYIGKYKSLFLTTFFNLFAAFVACIIAYFYERNTILPKLTDCIKEPYFIPYILLLPSTYFLWFFITKTNGAAYAGLFESTYILIFIVASILLGNSKLDWQFLFGAILITGGVMLIQNK